VVYCVHSFGFEIGMLAEIFCILAHQYQEFSAAKFLR